jgi:hypothetical protein
MKKCTKCGKDKPLDQFYKHPNCKDGINTKCKKCMSWKTQQEAKNRQDGFFKWDENNVTI